MKKSLTLLLSLNLFCSIMAQDRVTGELFATRSEVLATHAMAATSQPLATQAALEILRKGGNAVDAAIAANAVLGVVEPTGSGIGGDLFAMIWVAKEQKLVGLNGSGRASHSVSLGLLRSRGITRIPAYGGLPVSVPGCVDGWFSMHSKYGSMSMAEILQPAIGYAEQGFPVSELIAYYMERSAMVLKDFPGFTNTYMPGGRTPVKGEVFSNPDLAKTLTAIASGGRDAFYSGDMAGKIVASVKAAGGYMEMEDLIGHTSTWVEPVSCDYRGYTIWELPPNGQGIAALQILNILEGYDIAAMGPSSPDYLHLFIEAKKLAFEDRARYYADPAFSDIPLNTLISKDYATSRRALINPDRAARSFPPGLDEAGNTIYLTVADQWGNMVSLIQSNYRGMGSGVIPEGLGFILQDRGEMFSLEEGHPNVIAPGKRPFHTIIPAFITKDGKPWVSFGVMGGAMQPQGHAQIVVNLVDFGMGLQEAGDAPRIQHDGSSEPTGERMTNGGVVYAERGIPYETIRELMKKGHKLAYDLGGYGGYQAILRDTNGVYHGASESRKDGQAAGY